MNFYNPFKPHIVQDANGEYWVRRLTLQGWTYINSIGRAWYAKGRSDNYCSLESAREEAELLYYGKVKE